MKGAVLLFVVYAAFAQAYVPGTKNPTPIGVDECPPGQQIDWTIEWLMRHEDCNRFYKCTHGEPVVMRCYGDLFFNLETWQCDWQFNVDCTDRIIPDSVENLDPIHTTTSTTTTPTTTTTTTPTTTTTTTTTTPTTTTTTTPTTTTTTTPTTTTTTPTTTTTTPTTTTTTPSTTTADPNFLPNGCPVDPHIHWLLPHENECNWFYYCVWGERVLRFCPPDLYFNPVLMVCDYPYRAGCTSGRPPFIQP